MRENKLHTEDNLSHTEIAEHAEPAGHKIPRAVRMRFARGNIFVSRGLHGFRRECGSQGSPRYADEM